MHAQQSRPSKDLKASSLTLAELREVCTDPSGDVHPVLDGPIPTAENAIAKLERAFALFRGGYAENGGRVAKLMALEGVIELACATLHASKLNLLDPLFEHHREFRDLEVTGNRSPALSSKTFGSGKSDADAVADVKARAIAISNILKDSKPCSRREADRQAAAYVSPAAVAAGLIKANERIDWKQIDYWRRNLRSRPAGKSVALPPTPFRRRSLADRVERVWEEALYKARALERLDGRLDLNKLIEVMLPEQIIET